MPRGERSPGKQRPHRGGASLANVVVVVDVAHPSRIRRKAPEGASKTPPWEAMTTAAYARTAATRRRQHRRRPDRDGARRRDPRRRRRGHPSRRPIRTITSSPPPTGHRRRTPDTFRLGGRIQDRWHPPSFTVLSPIRSWGVNKNDGQKHILHPSLLYLRFFPGGSINYKMDRKK